VLLGDSLAEQAATYLAGLLDGKTLVPRFFGGTAPCDWREMDLQATATSVVVISFTGNSMTPCMSDGYGGQLHGQSLIAKYRVDLTVLLDRVRQVGAVVLLVGQPPHSDALPGNADLKAINEMYAGMAGTNGVSFVDAGAAVEGAGGTYVKTLPCLADEVECGPAGTNVVRNDDGVHFCPGPPSPDPCGVYSSGAFRFAKSIAAAVNSM
jgi:hypothetical protein